MKSRGLTKEQIDIVSDTALVIGGVIGAIVVVGLFYILAVLVML